jgi:membrane associated rhomboid family serine protease
MRTSGRIPWATISISVISVVLAAWPSAAVRLEDTDSDLIEMLSAPWRVFSAHFVHRSFAHLAWNLPLFALLAGSLERRRGAGFTLGVLALLSLAVALGVRAVHQDWTSYRGASGIVYGLVVVVGAGLSPHGDRPRVGSSPSDREHTCRAIAILFALALTGKTVLEIVGAPIVTRPNFYEGLAVRFLPGSHLGGLIGGAILAAVASHARGGSNSSRSSRHAAPGSSASRIAPITAMP